MIKKIISLLAFLAIPSLAMGAAWFSFPSQGGTGTSTPPSYGQILVGNSGGTYSLMATSSLGLGSWSTTSTNYWATTYTGSLTAGNMIATNLFSSSTALVDGTTTMQALNLNTVGTGIKFADGTYQYTSANPDGTFSTTSADYYVHSSTTIPKTYTVNAFTATQNFVGATFSNATSSAFAIDSLSGILKGNGNTSPISVAVGGVDYPGLSTDNTFSGGNTFGTATTTTLVVSDQSLSLGGGKIYKIQHDRFGIPQATTTDETAKFGTVLSPSESITITSVDMQISSTTQLTDYSNNGITFNINIGNVMSSTSPMTVFSTVQWVHGTSSTLSFTPDNVSVVPAGYSYWFTFGTASTSQIQMLNANVNYFEN